MRSKTNNLQILPLYDTVEEQNHRKSWVDTPYTTAVPTGELPPFQWVIPNVAGISQMYLVDLETEAKTNITQALIDTGLRYTNFVNTESKIVLEYPATLPLLGVNVEQGRYYLEYTGFGGEYGVSEVFDMRDNMDGFLRIDYWHDGTIRSEGDAIVYNAPYKSRVYLQADVARQDYGYEERVQKRLGKDFATQQISWKLYHFRLPLPEYLLDAMRAIRLHDHVQVIYNGEVFDCDSFLMDSPKWESHADVADVEFEFRTNTVVVVNGRTNEGGEYTVESGSCILATHKAKAIFETGSQEWINGVYEDENGDTQTLMTNDLVVTIDGTGLVEVHSYTGVGYAPITPGPLDTLSSKRENRYWFMDSASNLWSEPFIETASSGGFAKGKGQPGTVVKIYKTGTPEPILLGEGSDADFRGTGIQVGAFTSSDTLYAASVTATCGEISSGAPTVPEVPAGRGIGWMRVGSTFVVR